LSISSFSYVVEMWFVSLYAYSFLKIKVWKGFCWSDAIEEPFLFLKKNKEKKIEPFSKQLIKKNIFIFLVWRTFHSKDPFAVKVPSMPIKSLQALLNYIKLEAGPVWDPYVETIWSFTVYDSLLTIYSMVDIDLTSHNNWIVELFLLFFVCCQ